MSALSRGSTFGRIGRGCRGEAVDFALSLAVRAAANEPAVIRAIAERERAEAPRPSGGASVAAKETAKALGGLDGGVGVRRSLEWNDRPIFETLVVSLCVVTKEIFADGHTERSFAEENEPVEAL